MTLGTVPGLKDDITPCLSHPRVSVENSVRFSAGKVQCILHEAGGICGLLEWSMNRSWPIYGIDGICDIPIYNIPGG